MHLGVTEPMCVAPQGTTGVGTADLDVVAGKEED